MNDKMGSGFADKVRKVVTFQAAIEPQKVNTPTNTTTIPKRQTTYENEEDSPVAAVAVKNRRSASFCDELISPSWKNKKIESSKESSSVMDSSQIPSLQHDITISEISADDRRSPNISPNQHYGAVSQNFKRKRTVLFGHSDPLLKEAEHDADLSD